MAARWQHRWGVEERLAEVAGGEEELPAAAGARAGVGGGELWRVRECRQRGGRREGIRWIRWAGPFLWWIRWAGPFLWAFLLFSPYSMTIDLLFFLFFQVLKYVLIN